jgi:DNA-binding transcriptional LysR family regulator
LLNLLSLARSKSSKELGVSLLERTQRNVRLTTAGLAFLEQARLTLQEHERSIQTARHLALKEPATLSLAFEPCAAFHGLPQIIQDFGRRYPEVRLTTYQLAAPKQEEALKTRRIEAGFVHPPIRDQRLVFEKVLEERFLAVLPANHQLARRNRVNVQALSNEPFILFPRQVAPGCFDIIGDLCRTAGFSPRVGHETTDMGLCLRLIAPGAGLPSRRLALRNGAYRAWPIGY